MKRNLAIAIGVLTLGAAVVIWSPRRDQGQGHLQSGPVVARSITADPTPALADCCSIIRIPHLGNSEIDHQIQKWQRQLTNRSDLQPSIERIGWAFVSKARSASDAGYYVLAKQAALCLDQMSPNCPASLLLQGHVLQNLHQFQAAKPLAQKLVATRGIAVDFGLLGDVLLEIGQLPEAIEAYQTMADLQPSPQAYVRGAQVRWLTGDLPGAIELMAKAARSGGPDPEATAWAYTRLAYLQLLQEDTHAANEACAAALQVQPESAAALTMKGRLGLSTGDYKTAIASLKQAESLNPLPETQWLLIESLRSDGQFDEAAATEGRLRQTGEARDPRTFALFLASEKSEPAKAVELARRELQERADVHTHDALAWANFSAGNFGEAAQHSALALRHHTADPRIYYHSALIAAQVGDPQKLTDYGRKALERVSGLLPSEVERLLEALTDTTAEASQN